MRRCGWAIDLYLGVATRVQEDTEIAVPTGGSPRSVAPFRSSTSMSSARASGNSRSGSLRCDAPNLGPRSNDGDYHLDVFRDPHDGDVWICRHERAIHRPYTEVIKTTRTGSLHGSRNRALVQGEARSGEDNADFAAVQPSLDQRQRLG